MDRQKVVWYNSRTTKRQMFPNTYSLFGVDTVIYGQMVVRCHSKTKRQMFPNGLQFVWCWFMDRQWYGVTLKQQKGRCFLMAYSLFGVDLWTDRWLYGVITEQQRGRCFLMAYSLFGVDLWTNRRLYGVILKQHRGKCFLMAYCLLSVDLWRNST